MSYENGYQGYQGGGAANTQYTQNGQYPQGGQYEYGGGQYGAPEQQAPAQYQDAYAGQGGYSGQNGQGSGNRPGVPRAADWWEAQTAKAFIKLEPMFDGEGKYGSKMILSFVKHNGAANGYKRTDNIRIYLPMVKGVSNGESGQKQVIGQSGESLVSMVRCGDFYRMCAALKRNAAAANSQYPEPLFQTIGGSGEKRGKDGSFIPVKFRKFTIAPNMQMDGYLFTAMECDGTKTRTGGYAPMQGMPNRHSIMVPVSEHSMRGLAENMAVHWNAYVTAMEIKDILGR